MQNNQTVRYDEETHTLFTYDKNGKLIRKSWVKDFTKWKQEEVGRRSNGLAL